MPACWDCLRWPQPGDQETPAHMLALLDQVPAAMRPGIQQLYAMMKELGAIANTVDIESPWLTPNATTLDTTTFRAWVEQRANSALARSLMYLASRINGATNAEPGWVSVLHIAYMVATAPQPTTPEKWLIKGGAGQVPALLAKNITSKGGKIFTSSPVVELVQKSGKVIARTEMCNVTAKAAIVAMPPHLAGRIAYDPPMPMLRDELTQRMPMGNIIKCVAVYETPFWRDNMTTTWPKAFVFSPGNGTSGVHVAFDISPPASLGYGTPGVLATFVTIDSAKLYSDSPAARQQGVLKSYANWYGPKALKPINYIEAVWGQEPYTGGAYAATMVPGGWTGFGKALKPPVGRIHWAGTEVSTSWPGFFEGAIKAGQDAAVAVAAQLKQ